ncbi:MAG: hypothetical protein PHU83_00780, partial [Eubacteriales bacterium]|nr:hypothetical protein [Eubacteriales bacterium]
MRKSFVWFIAVLTTVTILSANLSNDHKHEVRADQVTLQIDASNVINAMDPQMRGSTIGIWTNQHYYPTANPKLVNMLKEAGMKLLRYPAGSEADDTMFERSNTGEWYKGTSPYTRRMRADHLDAFISLCRQVGAEPLIVVNAKIDNPAMAADIVKYCNVEHDYNVRKFEIGNEPIYWQNTTVSQYADRVKRYADAMKAIDPSISILSSAAPQPTTINSWLTPVMKTAGSKIDAVTIHWYPLWDGATSPSHPQYPSIPHLLYYDYGPSGNQQGAIMFSKRFV